MPEQNTDFNPNNDSRDIINSKDNGRPIIKAAFSANPEEFRAEKKTEFSAEKKMELCSQLCEGMFDLARNHKEFVLQDTSCQKAVLQGLHYELFRALRDPEWNRDGFETLLQYAVKDTSFYKEEMPRVLETAKMVFDRLLSISNDYIEDTARINPFIKNMEKIAGLFNWTPEVLRHNSERILASKEVIRKILHQPFPNPGNVEIITKLMGITPQELSQNKALLMTAAKAYHRLRKGLLPKAAEKECMLLEKIFETGLVKALNRLSKRDLF